MVPGILTAKVSQRNQQRVHTHITAKVHLPFFPLPLPPPPPPPTPRHPPRAQTILGIHAPQALGVLPQHGHLPRCMPRHHLRVPPPSFSTSFQFFSIHSGACTWPTGSTQPLSTGAPSQRRRQQQPPPPPHLLLQSSSPTPNTCYPFLPTPPPLFPHSIFSWLSVTTAAAVGISYAAGALRRSAPSKT